MRISHETIYRSLYVQSRGELRRQLTAQLRTGRSTRRARSRTETRGRIPEMVPIAERPPEVDDRRVPGHWEGDLLLGAAGKSAIATLVERHTRYVLLARLGQTARTATVTAALEQRIKTLPAHLVKSLDLGPRPRTRRAQALHRTDRRAGLLLRPALALATRQQREHQRAAAPIPPTHRAIWPSSTQSELDQIAAELNGRPRKTLDWDTPAERMQVLLR